MPKGLTDLPPPAERTTPAIDLDSVATPLQGAADFRDLGGLPTADGAVTRPGLLYRSACLSELTEADEQRLRSLGIRTRVDLRSGFERDDAPAVRLDDIHTVHAPILDAPDSRAYVRLLVDALDGLRGPGDVLVAMLRLDGGSVARAFTAVAGGMPAVFHCTTGRDRTGLLTAILLRLAGVQDAMIELDYAASLPLRPRNAAAGPVAAAQAPLRALAHLDERFGGVEPFLLAHGVARVTIAQFRRRFAT